MPSIAHSFFCLSLCLLLLTPTQNAHADIENVIRGGGRCAMMGDNCTTGSGDIMYEGYPCGDSAAMFAAINKLMQCYGCSRVWKDKGNPQNETTGITLNAETSPNSVHISLECPKIQTKDPGSLTPTAHSPETLNAD